MVTGWNWVLLTKTENVMVTGWNWVLLTDIASFKPAILPEDITLHTSTLTHLDIAAVILHQKGFLIPDRPIRCCHTVF